MEWLRITLTNDDRPLPSILLTECAWCTSTVGICDHGTTAVGDAICHTCAARIGTGDGRTFSVCDHGPNAITPWCATCQDNIVPRDGDNCDTCQSWIADNADDPDWKAAR